jgi:hypothetical protein
VGKPGSPSGWAIGIILILLTVGQRDATAFNSAPCFPGALQLLAGEPTSSVAAGDFNRDLALDLAVIASGSAAVLLGDGTGGFGAPTRFAAGSSPAFAATADLNRDRKADLVVANFGYLAILIGDGFGRFRLPTTVHGANWPRAITIADFNGDKDPDVAVANYDPDAVFVFLGNGAGGLVASSANRVPFPSVFAVAAADFNRDRHPDLIVQTATTGVVCLFLGEGNGRFGAPTWFPAGVSPMGVAIADFNEDAIPDLAVANGTSTAASVLLGDGAGGLGPAIPLGTGVQGRGISTADFDRDGHFDLAVAKEGPGQIEFFSGNGAGAFVGPFRYSAGTYPRQLAVGDFNRDARPDVASSNYDGVSVSLNGGLTLVPPTATALPPGKVGDPYQSPVFSVKGGSAPYTISQTGSLPPGMSFSISPPPPALRGTPTSPGEFRFGISVSSANGCSVEGTYILRVSKASPVIPGSSSSPLAPKRAAGAGDTPEIPTLDWRGLALLGLLLTGAAAFHIYRTSGGR